MQSFQELEAYQRAFELQQMIFNHSKRWPKEESCSLVGQIRRASRGVAANISQAWARRRCQSQFHTRLSDAEAELAETRHWLRTAAACSYIDSGAASAISHMADVVGHLLGAMMQNHEQFCLPPAPPTPAPPQN